MKYPGREGRQLEFKETLESYSNLIKTVVAFSNDIGGKILIRIENKTNEVIGLSEAEIDIYLERIPQAIFDAITPTCRPLVRVFSYLGKQLVEIVVSQGYSRPFYVNSLGLQKGTYIRVGAHTKLADSSFIEELARQGLGRSYDEEPVAPSEQVEFDVELLKELYHTTSPKNEQLLADKVLVVDRITSELKVSVSGVLFFAKNPLFYIPHSEILLTVHSGNEIGTKFKTKDFSGTLEAMLEFTMTEIEKELVVEQSVKGLTLETQKLEIPGNALREVLLNALIHRSYDIKDNIKVNIFSDRIVVFSPGNFPGPITDFLSGVSYARNPHLRQLARRKGLVEKRGLGFQILFSSLKANGNPAPLIEEKGLGVYVTLFRNRVTKEQILPDHLQALESLREQKLSFQTGEVAELLKVNRNTARKWLEEAYEKKIVRKTGKGRGAKWEWNV